MDHVIQYAWIIQTVVEEKVGRLSLDLTVGIMEMVIFRVEILI